VGKSLGQILEALGCGGVGMRKMTMRLSADQHNSLEFHLNAATDSYSETSFPTFCTCTWDLQWVPHWALCGWQLGLQGAETRNFPTNTKENQ